MTGFLPQLRRTALLGALLSAPMNDVALAHDQACQGGEEELEPRVRQLAASTHVAWHAKGWLARTRAVRVQLLGINDFHGRLNPGLLVAGRPVGGAAVLASYLRAEQRTFAGSTFIVHAGDHVGASPPESALLQDEPAIEVFNLLANGWCKPLHGILPMCNVVGTLGNHEFDEGVGELQRLVWGGNHAEGPYLSSTYQGATFPYVSANVVREDDGRLLMLPYVIRYAGGEPIAFTGAVLENTPSVVTPEGVRGVRFLDEAEAVNRQVRQLRKLGVESIVVLIHQGGRQTAYQGHTQHDATALQGEIADIVARLDGAVDVVVSGHAHAFSNALLPNRAGKPTLVTQAFSSGTAYADIELTIDRQSHDVTEKGARIVTTFADEGPGLEPALDVARLVDAANAKVAPLVERKVGDAGVAITREASAAGESALGNLIADAQRASVGADLAFMNPGGIRADLAAGTITWGELFTIQPFGNDVVRLELLGAQVLALLEQQWADPARPRILQVSGLTVTWDPARPAGARVVQVQVAGRPLDPVATYSVAVNSFLASGGDGFTVLAEGKKRVVGPVDLDALVDYVEAREGPLLNAREGRILLP